MVGVLILFHEMGHFLAARAVGIKVLKFSVGFGPKIFSIKGKVTEYILSAIPLGGYVRMSGEQAIMSGEPVKEGDYYSKGPGKRILVVISGPLMNLILAFLCIFLVYSVGYKEFYFPPVIGSVMETVEIGGKEIISPAKKAGLNPGDRIIAINGEKVSSWDELQRVILNSRGEEVELRIDRGGNPVNIKVNPAYDREKNYSVVGVYPVQDNVVSVVVPGSPADKAGVKKGDRVLYIGKNEVTSWRDIEEGLKIQDKVVKLTIERDGERRLIKIEREGIDEISKLGILTGMKERLVRKNLLQAATIGIKDTLNIVLLTLKGIWGLITGQVNPKEALGGPLTIADFAGKFARSGWYNLINFMALLSVWLFILNLLPIPVLDGGNVVINIVEAIKGGMISLKARMIFQQIGFLIIVSIVVFTLVIDFIRYVF